MTIKGKPREDKPEAPKETPTGEGKPQFNSASADEK